MLRWRVYLGLFLKACQAGRIKKGSLLLVENLDRLSRNEAMKAINLIQQIVEAGVTIVTRIPERVINAETVNDFGLLMEIVVTAFRAHEESKTKGFRVAQRWDEKRRLLATNPHSAKMTGKGPSWLKLDEDGKTWKKIPERVAIVKQIFQGAAQGLGAWQIVQRLNKDEVPPINPKGWQISSLLFLLRSRSVLGEFQAHKGYGSRKDRIPQGEPIPDYYPRIIDDNLFYRVQAGLKRRTRVHRGKPYATVPNLFTGLVHDARDGSLCHITQNGNGQRLVSSGAIKGKRGSTFLAIPYPVFENAFLRWIVEIEPSEWLPVTGDRKDIDIEAEEGKLADVNLKIEKTKAKLLSAGDFDTLADLLIKLETQKRELEQNIEQLRAELHSSRDDSLEDTRELVRRLNKIGPDKASSEELVDLRSALKARIASLVSEIWILPFRAGQKTFIRLQVVFDGGNEKEFEVLCIPQKGIQYGLIFGPSGKRKRTSPPMKGVPAPPGWADKIPSRNGVKPRKAKPVEFEKDAQSISAQYLVDTRGPEQFTTDYGDLRQYRVKRPKDYEVSPINKRQPGAKMFLSWD